MIVLVFQRRFVQWEARPRGNLVQTERNLFLLHVTHSVMGEPRLVQMLSGIQQEGPTRVGDVTVRDTFLITVTSGQPDMTQLSGSCLQNQTPTRATSAVLHNNYNNNSSSTAKVALEKEACELQTIFASPTEPPHEEGPAAKDAMKDPKIHTFVNNNVHREMAVDVPDSFVAVTKTAPRYPPPRRKPPRVPPDTSSLKKNGLYHFTAEPTTPNHVRSVSSQDGCPDATPERRTPPTPRISELLGKAGEPPQEEEKLIELNQLHRIRKYQEELRKRKEDEERHAQEEEFLRSSLRGSQKLRALEKRASSGLENSAFLLEEGDAPAAPPPDGKLVASEPDGEPPELTKLYEPATLLDTLHNLEAGLAKLGVSESMVELEKLFHNLEFQSLLTLHNKVQELSCFKCLPTPVCADAQVISLEVVRALQDVPSKDAKELLHLLGKHPFENLMFCHDKVAASQVVPDVSEEEELLARLSQYTEESIKIVRIEKTTEPLGATVKNDGEAVIVGRIVKGGIAEKSGLLHEGDEILEVNGLELRGKTVNDVCDIMASMSGTLTFLIVPTQYDIPKQQTRESVIHLKAHFDYEPDDDLYVPCRELGMSFQKGDVLHVISQEDPNWWQAYREGEEDQLLAGLIPSKNFQQQREVMKQAVVGDTREKKSKKGKFFCAKRHHRRKKKKMYNLSYNDDTDAEQILTYEEVRLYYPRAHQKRPLVLIGPQKVGRHELRQRLMEDTNRFAAAVPHTSRTKKDSEVNGVDYFFISRTQFEADILAGRFVEHGEYQKSYYGTSLDAIRSVIDAGKTCILNLHPQSLKILKKSDLMPYVVFIAPPSLEKLRVNCLKMDQPVKDDELKDIIEKGREMEEFYGHYFDLVLINVDLEKTYSELLHEISVIEREPQWVPSTWIKDDST
ncbi:MAGUK p55 subfamily member 5 [Caerostris darwini]|uniref:MAGUK p55 subfamily member 5 n=1 Tax=Caerostris darwini TaxID=1538125 RepID=A0AAV4X8L0_9ARAC|nr:MAGUK p55 subfamily member 5 [Caerostris darwini]